MEDRGLRDIERWRDKIEVRLDNRQVFFLFFGSALVACMLFVLGVIVGKRLESRGRAVAPEIEDPLALLDKVATSPRPAQSGVTFPQALFGAGGKNGAGEKHGKKAAPAALEGDTDGVKPAVVALRESKSTEDAAKTTATASAEAKSGKTEAKPAASLPEEKKSEAATAKIKVTESKRAEAKSAATKPAEAKPAEAKAAETKSAEVKPAEIKEAKPMPIPTIAAGGESKSKGHFTLQLSSFQDKAEAEAFAQKFTSERPYMVVSEIPGKGTWYRVRVGDYASSKDAIAAKDSFEKKHNVIAYVAQK
jgi:DedD protein